MNDQQTTPTICNQSGAIGVLIGDEWQDLRSLVVQSVTELMRNGIGVSSGLKALRDLANLGQLSDQDMALTGVTLESLTNLAANPQALINDGLCLNCFEEQVNGKRPFCSDSCASHFKAETLAWVSGDGFYYLNPAAY